MIENIYCIYDNNAGIALKPFSIHRNDVAPCREVTEVANNKDSIIHKHAADFELLHVATIDLVTLEVTGLPAARRVMRCIDSIDTE